MTTLPFTPPYDAPLDAPLDAPRPREGGGWLQVHARDQVTRYLRRGTGRPIVALSDDTAGDAPWPVLAAALSTRHRVLLPEIPPRAAGHGFGAWLDAFLDGVGVEAPSLVAFGARCADAVTFAAAEAGEGRLGRVVLVPGSAREAAALAGAMPIPVPVMVVPPVAPTDMAFPAVRRFLEGAAASG